MESSQQKGKGQRKGAGPSSEMTLRLRDDERVALGRLILGSGKSLTDEVREAILLADRVAAGKAISTPLERLDENLRRQGDAVSELGKRLEAFVAIFRKWEEDQKAKDAARDDRFAALEQGLALTVGGVVALGTGSLSREQNDAWLRIFPGCMGSYEKGILSRQLLDAAVKLEK